MNEERLKNAIQKALPHFFLRRGGSGWRTDLKTLQAPRRQALSSRCCQGTNQHRNRLCRPDFPLPPAFANTQHKTGGVLIRFQMPGRCVVSLEHTETTYKIRLRKQKKNLPSRITFAIQILYLKQESSQITNSKRALKKLTNAPTVRKDSIHLLIVHPLTNKTVPVWGHFRKRRVQGLHILHSGRVAIPK